MLTVQNGNKKLGDNVFTVSRPVGETCPKSCEFLHNGCYAEHTEKMYPGVRKSATNNLSLAIDDWQKIRAMLINAKRQNKAVRIHVSGDWLLNGRLDNKYLTQWVKALESVGEQNRPMVWCYTHHYSPKLLTLSGLGVSLYASVANSKQLEAAKRVGFTLFAWSDQTQSVSKRRGGTSANRKHKHIPTYLAIGEERFLVCPEMRKVGVTCTGSDTSIACNYCAKGLGNVIFLLH